MTIDRPIIKGAGTTVEVAYKPGVMNPEAASIIKAAKDLGINLLAADSSWEYSFFPEAKNINEILEKLLVNKTVEYVVAKPPKTLLISSKTPSVKKITITNLNDEQLMNLSKDKLFLNLEEMKLIQNYYRKINSQPTDCEIEILAQTWSEHCVHKTFKAKLEIDGRQKEPLFVRIKKTLKNNPKIIISAFDDNSGVIDFYDGYGISGKVETHNSPSAIEPYGGAMTGSGGVFRDILGTGEGAKPIASTDIFCLAPPDLSENLLPPGCLAPEFILRKVIAGVRDYGNRVGIPTNNGSLHFHQNFRAKPTVAVGSYGIIPIKRAKKGSSKKGDLILTLGGATGRDGIHGATFSSGEMTDKTITVSGSAVQIGNAIEEKRIIDAVLQMRDQNLIRAITDCGAGGYSSAIGEMGEKTGAIVYLEKVPVKYPGLAPWEIFLSESQERMVMAISPANLKKVEKIAKIYNVNVNVVGKFDGSKRLKVTYNNQLVCNLDMNFMHHGLNQRKMYGKTMPTNIREKINPIKNLEKTLTDVMSHPNICSKEPIVRLYDHNVQGTSSLHPFGGVNMDAPNDGTVITPILGKPYGMVLGHGLNPVLNDIDPYWGSIWAATEAVANFTAIGGDIKNAALIDNFIWPFPDEESLASLDKSVDAICDFSNVLKMPFVSGKDSLSSTYRFPDGKFLKIPPVLLVSIFGKIPNVIKTASSDFKKVGSTLVLVGKFDEDALGGSVLFDVTKSTSAKIPKVDLKNLPATLKSVQQSIKSGEALSIHDVSEGGLVTAIAEMSFGGSFGASINLEQLKVKDPVSFIFNETPGTFVVEVENEKIAKELFKGVEHKIIGKTIQSFKFKIYKENKIISSINLSLLKSAWQKPMEEIFG